jgi:uncharacterized protein (DUF362 family)
MIKYYKNANNKIQEIVDTSLNLMNLRHGSKVFIKPNFSGRPPILLGENTSLDVLEAIVKNLVSKDCEIIIGHYALLSLDKKKFPFEKMIEMGGYDILKKYNKVKFLNLEEEEHKTERINEFTIFIPKILDKVDYIINVPKAKTHMETQASLSIKNLMGLIDGHSRKLFHKFFLNELLGYLGVFIKPSINIVDGITSMEGNGPHEGTNIDSNFICVGDDLVELDSFLAHMMGFNFNDVTHIKKAQELGVGNYASRDIIDKYQKEIKDFKKPDTYMKLGRQLYFWPTTSCSLCHEVMRDMKKKLKKDFIFGLKFYYYAIFSKKRINIIIGRCENMEYFKNDINVCIGICTKWFAEENNIEFLMGCPPSADKVIDFVFKKFRDSK